MSATFATPVEMSTETQKLVDYFQRFLEMKKRTDQIFDERKEKINCLLSTVQDPIIALLKRRFDEKLGRGHPLTETDWEPVRSCISDRLSGKSLIQGSDSISTRIYNEYKKVIFHCVIEKTEEFSITPVLRQTPKIPISVDEMRTYYFHTNERTWVINQLNIILSPLEAEYKSIHQTYDQQDEQFGREFETFMSQTTEEEFKSNIMALLSLPEVENHFPHDVLESILTIF
jgi:hypothetical protein